MKVYAAVDRLPDADILVAVFSRKSLAQKWIKVHKNDRYSAEHNLKRHYDLGIEESELDPAL